MSSPVIETAPLGFPWQTLDPFLFCAHHNDAYPKGDERMAPQASLSGRHIGSDFSGKDGWSMYHGETVPGFPQHPHRGFETITIARQGFIDHSDSLGAAARFGQGDVQWMTAGAGVVHSEMFPLVNKDNSNHTELFQIWLNLPAKNKMAAPYFSMYWNEAVPKLAFKDAAGRTAEVAIYAGELPGARGVSPPPDSWAADSKSQVRILTLRLEPGAEYTLPPPGQGANRVAYFFEGDQMSFGGEAVSSNRAVLLRPDVEVAMRAGSLSCELLILEGKPIGEPVAQHGPFVMNTELEIRQAFQDYQTTRFGGWPWGDDAPVHPRDQGRFARHADGRVETPA